MEIEALTGKLKSIAQNSFYNFDSGYYGHGKRSNPNEAVSTPSKRLRKELPNTPTRQFVSTTVVDNDPVVAVSRIIMLYQIYNCIHVCIGG